jgi:SAM-dependent methyltransferase
MTPLETRDNGPMRALTWARERLREKGLIDTAKVAVSVVLDSTFDWRYGTSTSGKVNSDQLGVTGGNQIHAKRYGATKVRPLLALLKSLDVATNGVFVDFGSGKGRALMVAALYGFRRIVGVEFSPQLHEAARRNVEIFLGRTGLPAKIDLVLGDVAAYPIAADQNVFYMYNPFDDVVMAQVLANLRESIERSPRKVWLIYGAPLLHDAVDRAAIFQRHSLVEIGGSEFRVYASG